MEQKTTKKGLVHQKSIQPLKRTRTHNDITYGSKSQARGIWALNASLLEVTKSIYRKVTRENTNSLRQREPYVLLRTVN